MPLLRFSPTFLCHRWCQLAEVIAIIAPTEPAPLCCQAGYPARLQPSHHRVGTLRDHPASRIADMHTFPSARLEVPSQRGLVRIPMYWKAPRKGRRRKAII